MNYSYPFRYNSSIIRGSPGAMPDGMSRPRMLIPDNVKAENTRAYQRQVTSNIIEAIEKSGIRYIVNMSSLGSHMHEGNGMMGGTGKQEVD